MNQFTELENYIVDVVNTISLPIETKKLLKDIILEKVVISCKKYDCDPEFKNEVDRHAMYMSMKDNIKEMKKYEM